MHPYRPQLDGLRTFAVVAVMVQHWLIPSLSWYKVSLGMMGVQLFFVLSGFLITGILFDARETLNHSQQGRGQILRAFYARRALRIFPLYFFYLFVITQVGWSSDPDGVWWYATYLGNFRINEIQDWARPFNHLWSLSIEEQFYVLSPLLMLFVPKRWLGAALWTCLAICAFHLLTMPAGELRVLPPGQFFGLVLGSLIALTSRTAAHRVRFFSWASIGATPVFFAAGLTATSLGDIGEALSIISFCCMSGGIILRANEGRHGIIGEILEQRVLIHLGKISYGLYIWHMIAWPVTERLGLEPLLRGPILTFAVFFTVTLVISETTFHVFEKPISSLKRYAPYVRPTPTSAPTPESAPTPTAQRRSPSTVR